MANEDFMSFMTKPEQLDAVDRGLIDAYVSTGIPLDALAYTSELKSLAKKAGFDPKNEKDLHRVFQRLLSLRKRALLPRIYSSSSSSSSS